ncbi:MAG: cytochrome c [Candidatus Eremiobacteraeota bacterium]|nr:cytochrome c [Candidatus Eremiobacteraeota bacterium]
MSQPEDLDLENAVAVSLYLDDASEPFARYRPPATVHLDTRTLDDGNHVLNIRARDAVGNVGVRTVPFVVQNGPGITVTGLRANERVSGDVAIDVNAFGGSEPFDPVRAESSGPIPVWTWVVAALIAAWAAWYGIAEFPTPASFAATPTYERNPVAAANAPLAANTRPSYSGHGAAAGFDYGKTGPQLYGNNCASCHGAAGAGTPSVFPPLVHDSVVTAKDPKEQIVTVLHGLHGKAIGGTTYAGQMPSFAQLSDSDIAAIIDHERTSWGNNAPLITPSDVKRAR